jgi:inner membrane protein
VHISPAAVVLAAAALPLADSFYSGVQRASQASGGLLDECAHLATGLLVIAAAGAAIPRALLIGVLAGSVLIDLDHVPQYLGTRWLTEGTARPYPHSMVTLLALVAVQPFARRRRLLALGVLIGVTVHFLRDMAEPASGLPLFWPLSKDSVRAPYALYAVLMGIALVVALHRRRGTPG